MGSVGQIVSLALLASILSSCSFIPIKKEITKHSPIQVEKIEDAKRFLSLGYEYLSKEDGLKAESMAIRSLKLSPTKEAYILLGKSLFLQGKYDSALEVLEQTFARYSEEESGLAYAYVLTVLGKSKEAIQVYEFLEEKYNTDPFYKWKLAILFKSLKEYKKALEKLESASFEKFPEKQEYYILVSEIYYLQNDLSKAEEYVQKAKQLGGILNKVSNLEKNIQESQKIRAGSQFLEKGEYIKSIENFQEAYQITENLDLLYFIGIAYLKMENLDQAIAKFKEILSKNSEYKDAYIGLAFALFKQQKTKESILILKNYLQVRGVDEEVLSELSYYQKEVGDIDGSIQTIQRGKKWNPDFAGFYETMGSIYLEQEKWEEAEWEFQEAFKRNNSQITKNYLQLLESKILIGKADSFFREGKINLAIQKIEAIKDWQTNPNALNYLGKIYLYEKKYTNAREHLEKSYQLEKENPNTLELLVLLYTEISEPEKLDRCKKLLENVEKSDSVYLLAKARKWELENELEKAKNLYLEILQRPNPPYQTKIRLTHLYLQMARKEATKGNFIESKKNISLARKYGDSLVEIENFANQLLALETLQKEAVNIEKAKELFQNGDWKNSLKEYLKIYSKWKFISVLQEIATCYEKLNEEEKGLTFLLKEKKYFTQNEKYTEILATYYLRMNLFLEAEKCLLETISYFPENSTLYYLLGLSQKESNPEKSIFHFTKSIQLQPNFAQAYMARGGVYFSIKDYANARKDFQILEHSQGHRGKLQLGVLALQEKKWTEAETIFRELEKKYPMESSLYFHLGILYFELGKKKESILNLEKAISMEIKDLYIHSLLKVCNHSGETEKFQKWKKILLNEFPSSRYSAYWIAIAIETENSFFYIQEIELLDGLVHTPEFYNQLLILNYGNSLSAYHTGQKKYRWRKESSSKFYNQVLVDKKILAIHKEKIEEIHPPSGEMIREIFLGLDEIEEVRSLNNIFISGKRKNKRILLKYSKALEFLGEVDLESWNWEISKKENIYFWKTENEEFSYKVLDFHLREKGKTQILVLPKKAEFRFLLSSLDSIFLLLNQEIMELKPDGNLLKRNKSKNSMQATYFATENSLYKVEYQTIHKYLFTIDEWKEIAILPDRISYFYKDDSGIFAITANQKIYILDEKGEILKEEKLSSSQIQKKLQIYSFLFR